MICKCGSNKPVVYILSHAVRVAPDHQSNPQGVCESCRWDKAEQLLSKFTSVVITNITASPPIILPEAKTAPSQESPE